MPQVGFELIGCNGVDLRGLGWRTVGAVLTDSTERPLRLRFLLPPPPSFAATISLVSNASSSAPPPIESEAKEAWAPVVAAGLSS